MNGVQRFFYGRNGFDQLNIFFFVLYVVFFVLSMIFPGLIVFSIIMVAIIVVMFWRMLSKNLEARRKENNAFLKIWKPIAQFFKMPFLRFRDRKTHKYVKCPACKKYMRVKKGKGEREINCPMCSNRFKVNS